MPILLRGQRKKPQKVTAEIKTFKGGSNLLLDEARIAQDEAVTATNLIQVQDGLWQQRWGTAYYGLDLGANCDGAIEFVKSDQTTEIIAIAGGTAYKSTDGGSWTAISGASFTSGTQCFFMQIAGFLYIANGTDSLARYDGSTLTTYSSLSAPANLTASRVASGLSSGVYTYYAEVTAMNSVGETVGSTEASITVNKQRDTWVAATDKGIAWSWDTVASATRYQLYISEQSGYEALLTSTTALNYTDDGSLEINPYITPPLSNTTTAPKFKSMTVSGNRIWATNDPNNPYTVYFSGTGQFIGTFSDFYGGGFINLEKGGRETPVSIVHYQTGTGLGRSTVLCKTPEGKGAVWQIEITTATVGDTTFAVPSATKVVGSFGSESILGVVATNNDVLFPNRKAMFSLGSQQNYYGILRTSELTQKIRPYWRSLIGSQIPNICAYFYDAKVFISVPTTSSGNSRIIILDTERNNWTVDWTISAKQFFEYTDSSNVTHFMYVPVGGSRLIELSEFIAGDLGVAFSTEYKSGRMSLQKFWKDFEKLDKVFIKLGNPTGTINFQVSGTQKTSPFVALATKAISPQSSLTGMGWDLMGSINMGDTSGTPTTFADSSDIRYVKIRKKLRDIQLQVTSDSYDTTYVLQSFIFEGTPVQTNPPSSWKLN